MLLASFIQALAEVPLTMNQRHANNRQAEVGGRTQHIASQHA
jgi:hypothetical protein